MMKDNLYETNKIQKIVETKLKKHLLLNEICYNKNIAEAKITKIAKELNVNYRTAKSLKEKYQMKHIIEQVKIDRALNELLFSCPEQIKVFEYLTTDLNYFCTFNEVAKVIPISRYNFNKVKNYITEELQNITKS